MRIVRVLAGIVAALSLAACSGGPEEPPPAADDAVTFTEHIAPLVYEHCAGCHRPGESAPFSLLTYRDVKKHDEQIAEVTASRFMPPWLPAADVGDFEGRRGLSDEQIDLLKRWHEEGSLEGRRDKLPPRPQWTEGWQLGPPDLVIEPSQDYTLPADGIDIFRNLIIPIPVEQRRYVRTIDLRPGNPLIVHHAVMRVDR